MGKDDQELATGLKLMRTGWSFVVGSYPDMYDLKYKGHLIFRDYDLVSLFSRFKSLCELPPDGREALESRYKDE